MGTTATLITAGLAALAALLFGLAGLKPYDPMKRAPAWSRSGR